MRNTSFRSAVLCSSALVALAGGAALAQENGTDDQDPSIQTVPDAPNAGTLADEGDTIVVTGSRLRSSTFNSVSPLTVLDADGASLEGLTDVASVLQNATVASGSSQVTAASSAAFVQNGGAGAETISLRGLGANRTLVLLNGRRAGPAGVRGGVSAFDLNVLPLSAIERIEILKDGASSIYGSDAIAGVVNIITKEEDGGSVDGFYSQPFDSGGEEFRVNGSYGKSFDRGRFRVTGDYFNQQELARGDRDFYRCGQAYVFDGDGNRADLIDPRTGKTQCRDLLWGHVWTYDYQYAFEDADEHNVPQTSPLLFQYDYDGMLAGLIPGLPADDANDMRVPSGWFPVNYNQEDIAGLNDWAGINVGNTPFAVTNFDHPYQDEETFIPNTERYTFFAEGQYDLTDSVQAYGEVLLNRRETKVNGYRQYWSYVYNDNFNFINFDTVADSGGPNADGWTGAQWLSPTAITNHSDDSVKVDYQRYVLGFTGGLGPLHPSWTWDLAVQHSRSNGEYTSDVIFADSIEDRNFALSECEAGEVTSVRGVPCMDVNWLSPELLAGNPTQAERAYLFGTEQGKTDYVQTSVEGFLGGELIDLPAGPLGLGLGFLYQEDEIEDTPGAVTLADNAWGSSGAGITEGTDSTIAYFGELNVPIIADKPFFENLTLNLSGRYTDVESYGNDTTYKVGLNWQVHPAVRLRATQGTSFRTPSLFELYLADQTSFVGQRTIDPCINWGGALENNSISQQVANNCAADGIPDDLTGGGASATVVTGGGLGVLEAETADTFTAGIVLTPSFIDLRIALDYFDIEIENEVSQLGASAIVGGCYSSDDFANEPLCDLFTRNPNVQGSASAPFLIDTVLDSFININNQANRGLDLTVEYNHEFGFGDLRFFSESSYQLEDEVQLLAEGDVEDYNGLAGDPKFVSNVNLEFTRGPWTAFWGVDLIGRTSNNEEYVNDNGTENQTFLGEQVSYKMYTEFQTYHAASLGYEFENGFTVRAGVANIFDEAPPAVTAISDQYTTAGVSAFYSQYDSLGRRAFINLRKSF
ncbi:TonB-dependent receptor domain-containing protein [Parvularcula dongshanensis]|uniref:Iron complex outermembrane receptor protein n=1 Tax=Parvularcula dongshanensis TaxID=1173995 RepID=A0A840I1Q1_9PROT|nr:TonB-dependent receptor [Parvularcula dongshanensis]MBB4658172.1 iron complex outermembrane receptor protein [Parvularcula dongshanensis]